MHFYRAPKKTGQATGKALELIVFFGWNAFVERCNKFPRKIERREVRAIKSVYHVCVPFVTLRPSLHRAFSRCITFLRRRRRETSFCCLFMFYAAIKTTRKQHNIIRYVLKILTAKT